MKHYRPAMHWDRVDGLTFCGRQQLPGYDHKKDCKSCMRFRSAPNLSVRVLVAKGSIPINTHTCETCGHLDVFHRTGHCRVDCTCKGIFKKSRTG
jgi:hypothetical protein